MINKIKIKCKFKYNKEESNYNDIRLQYQPVCTDHIQDFERREEKKYQDDMKMANYWISFRQQQVPVHIPSISEPWSMFNEDANADNTSNESS